MYFALQCLSKVALGIHGGTGLVGRRTAISQL